VIRKTVNVTRGEGTHCNELQNRTVSPIYSQGESNAETISDNAMSVTRYTRKLQENYKMINE